MNSISQYAENRENNKEVSKRYKSDKEKQDNLEG
jgi:hypothetical protein